MLDARIPRLGVSEFSTYSWTFEEDVLNYHAHGFGAIGLWRAKVSDFGEEKACEMLLENDMRVSSLHWARGDYLRRLFTMSNASAHATFLSTNFSSTLTSFLYTHELFLHRLRTAEGFA